MVVFSQPRSVSTGKRDIITIHLGFGSGSGFQISLDPDPVSAPGYRNKTRVQKEGFKSNLLEENLEIMTKVRQKWKRQQCLIKNHHKIDVKFSRQRCLNSDPVLKSLIRFILRGWIRIRIGLSWELDPDPVNIRPDPKPSRHPGNIIQSFLAFYSHHKVIHVFLFIN